MTTINDDDRFAPTHVVDTFYDEDSYAEAAFDRSAERWRAECSCGWTGDSHNEAALADDEGDDHRQIMVGSGDGLDRLMSEALDLQDDLAQAVMWLAENWSADLPVPRMRGTGSDGAQVDLLTYCGSAEDLYRAAELLGAPLVDEPAPDQYGNRYRRAVRRFGRVTLEVYRRIGTEPATAGAA